MNGLLLREVVLVSSSSVVFIILSPSCDRTDVHFYGLYLRLYETERLRKYQTVKDKS